MEPSPRRHEIPAFYVARIPEQCMPGTLLVMSADCKGIVTRCLDPTGTGRTRWAMRWKPALNAFAITFGGRFPAAQTY